MSTPVTTRTLSSMDTEKRITLKEAAELAGVTMRTINRWRADGLITVQYGTSWQEPATYDKGEVLRAARMRNVQLPDTN